MRKWILMVALVFQASVMAQDSMITVRKSDLPVEMVQKIEAQSQINDIKSKMELYGKWVGLGKEVGVAIREGLGALTDETDRFSKTNVGKFTMFIIAFKVLGYPVIQLFFGMVLFCFGTGLLIWYLFRASKMLKTAEKLFQNKELNPKEHYQDFSILQNMYREFAAHAGAVGGFWVAWIAICCLIIFVH